MKKPYRQFVAEAVYLPLIYCDMDGVLCDFKKRAEQVTKVSWSQKRDERDWDTIKKTKNFWHTLPWTSDGRRLWSYIKIHKPSILSATVQAKTDPNCRPGKDYWIKNNLGIYDGSRVNIVLRSQKQKHAMLSHKGRREPAVLIDDYPKNIREWQRKGGIGILHTSASSTISQLRKLGY